MPVTMPVSDGEGSKPEGDSKPADEKKEQPEEEA